MSLLSLPIPRRTPFGTVRAAPFTGSASLPSEVDVVVIGGGLNGVMAAWFLASRGVSTLLCEKAEIGCESSGRAFGWISELLLDPCKMPLMQESKRLWKEIHAACGETGLRESGLLYLAESHEELEFYGHWLESVRGEAAPSNRLLTSAEVTRHLPMASRKWLGGLYAPTDGCAEPVLAAPVVAAAAQRAGAIVVTGCAVRCLDIAAGRIAGVVTEKGRVRAKSVLFAGNAWSRLFLGNHGIDVPQLYFLMSMGRTTVLEDGPPGSGGQEHWAWRRQIDGSYSLGRLRGQRVPLTRDSIQLFSRFWPAAKAELRNLKLSLGPDARTDWGWARRWSADEPAPFERLRILEPRLDKSIADESLRLNAAELTPFARASIAEYWTGAITTTPDNLPIVSAVGKIPGLYLATGCAYGLTWSPALGKLMADLITGATPTLDPALFRYSRFFDGTPLRLTA